jgi:hypothetical protein
MHSNTIAIAITAAVVPLLLQWLMKSRSPAQERADGVVVLSYPGAWRKMLLALAVVPFALAAFILAMVHPITGRDVLVVLALIGFFAALEIPLGFEIFRRVVELSDEGLLSRSPWTGTVRMSWSGLVAASYNRSMQWVKLRDRDGRVVRVTWALSGGEALADRLERQGVPLTGPVLAVLRRQTIV